MTELEKSNYEIQIAELQKERICLVEQLEMCRQKNRELELQVSKLQGRVDAFMFCVTGGDMCKGGIGL